jgi:hypothetical protein
MIGNRTKISVGQYLALQTRETQLLVLEKCGAQTPYAGIHSDSDLVRVLQSLSPPQIQTLLDEVTHSTRMLRNNVSPKYLYDERWIDLERCLMLDGYRVAGDYSSGYRILTLDPTIGSAIPIDDDLTLAALGSNLPSRQDVVALMEQSANDFRKQPPDFNGSLISARVSLETIVKDMAILWSTSIPMPGDPTKFGANVAYLEHQVRFLAKEEVQGITGVYSFVSPGAHVPLGFTEQEMVRLGRSLIASVSYFLVKKFNGLSRP